MPIVLECNCSIQTQLQATVQEQVLTSPGYPIPYCNRLRCKWQLNAPEGYVVALKIKDFETDSSNDALAIYDGATTDGTALIELYSWFQIVLVSHLFSFVFGCPFQSFWIKHRSRPIGCGGFSQSITCHDSVVHDGWFRLRSSETWLESHLLRRSLTCTL